MTFHLVRMKPLRNLHWEWHRNQVLLWILEKPYKDRMSHFVEDEISRKIINCTLEGGVPENLYIKN